MRTKSERKMNKIQTKHSNKVEGDAPTKKATTSNDKNKMK